MLRFDDFRMFGKRLCQSLLSCLFLCGFCFQVYSADDLPGVIEAAVIFGYNGFVEGVNSVACSPTSDVVAACSGFDTVALYDVGTGRRRWNRVVDMYPTTVRFSPNGASLALADNVGVVRLLDAKNGETLWKVPHPEFSRGMAIAFSPSGKLLAMCETNQNGICWIRDVRRGHRKIKLKRSRPYLPVIYAVSFLTHKLVVVGGGGGYLATWDVTDGREKQVFAEYDSDQHKNAVVTLEIDRTAQRVLSGYADGTIRQWDSMSGKQLHEFREHKGYVLSVALSPDGKRFASGGTDGKLRLWRTGQGKPTTLGTIDSKVAAVDFARNGKTIVAGGGDSRGWVRRGELSAWSTTTGKQLWKVEGYLAPVCALDHVPDSSVVLSGDGLGEIRSWDTVTGKIGFVAQTHTAGVSSLKVSSDGKITAVSGFDGSVVFLNPKSGKRLSTLQTGQLSVTAIAISTSGARLATADRSGTIMIWNARVKTKLRQIKTRESSVNEVAFSPDDKQLVSASEDGKIHVFDVASGKRSRILEGHNESVRSVRFSPDGKRIASSCDDGTVRIWDLESGQVRWSERYFAVSVKFSHNGRYLAAIDGFASTVRVWDLKQNKKQFDLQSPIGVGSAMCFSADDSHVIAINRTVMKWALPK
jgi:WD40 repeat protein